MSCKFKINYLYLRMKNSEKRKLERQCLPEFFKRHIQFIKDNKMCCEECGANLKGHVSEVAHILPKSFFKSLMCSEKNVLYLCGCFSENQCHTNFDNFPQEKVKQMNIFPKVQQVFKELKEDIIEKLNYKQLDFYE